VKVLFLSAWFPYPPDNGSRIRAYNLIKALSAEHTVYLISLLQEDSSRESAGPLEDFCKVWSLHESRWFRPGTLRSVLGLFSRRPRSVVDTFDRRVRRSVEEAVKQTCPDVIVASTIGVAEYVPSDISVPCVLEEHNCEFAVMRRSAELSAGRLMQGRAWLGWKKAAMWEASVCRRFDTVVMVSDRDRDDLLAVASDLPSVQVVPNGVDTERYTPEGYDPEPGAVVYNGGLTYGANLDAVRFYADSIYPILRERMPGVKLMVTGRTPDVDLHGINDCAGIELVGYVDDIRTVLRHSSVCVVPLRQGGGSRLKILEAMASGVPVVSTTVGAEGIDCMPGKHLLIADEPGDFATAIQRVLTDHDLATRLSGEARALVVSNYNWTTIGKQFVGLVEETAAKRRAG
jgi:glycosyltransferase involved in cell wall biosynthesis